MSRVDGLHFCVDFDGWTSGYQLSIDTATTGLRLKGPKYNGSSKRLLTYVPSDTDLVTIAQHIADEQARRASTTGATS